jgi:hypothetical protein
VLVFIPLVLSMNIAMKYEDHTLGLLAPDRDLYGQCVVVGTAEQLKSVEENI